MAIEDALALLTSTNATLVANVGAQQLAVTSAVAGMVAVTARVNSGLNLVNNTADVDKPVSTATVTALGLKQARLVDGTNISTVNGQSLLSGTPLVIVRSATSLNRILYDDRATLRNTTSQLDDATMVEGLGLFMWANTQLEPDDDETCFNTTTTGQWLLQVPAQELIDAWNLFDASTTDDWREDEPTRVAAYILANK